MKTKILLLGFLMLATIIYSQNLIISEVVDGTGSGGYPKFVEITNTGSTTASLDSLKIKLYTNGNTSPTSTYQFPVSSLASGESHVLTNIDNAQAGQLWSDFNLSDPVNATYSVNAINSNGDDVYELTDKNDVVIDVYGEVGTDGTGTYWEFQDSYAYRDMGIVNGNQTFTQSEWIFGGANALDGQAADLSGFLSPGTHIFNSPNAPIISNISLMPLNPTSASTVGVSADVVPQGSATIANVTLLWDTSSSSLTNQINMSLTGGNTYTTDTDIPAHVNGTFIYYQIKAIDDTPDSSFSAQDFYYIGNLSPQISNVIHTPAAPTNGDNVSVSADIIDDGTLVSTYLLWCDDGTSFSNNINMSLDINNTYITDNMIPAQAVDTTISYKIIAVDNEDDTTESAIYTYTVIPQPGSYTLLNGDFEYWTGNTPDDWPTIDNGINIYKESSIVNSGSFSAKVTVTTGSQSNTDIRQPVSVFSGNEYEFSVYVYHTDTTVKARIFAGGYSTYSDNTIINSWQQVTTTLIPTMDEDIEVGLRFYDQNGFADSSITYIDGYEMVNITGINKYNNTEISVYPNPASKFINFSNLSSVKSVKIYDLNGSMLKKFTAPDINRIDISELSKGIYILKIETKTNKTKRQKIIKS